MMFWAYCGLQSPVRTVRKHLHSSDFHGDRGDLRLGIILNQAVLSPSLGRDLTAKLGLLIINYDLTLVCPVKL